MRISTTVSKSYHTFSSFSLAKRERFLPAFVHIIQIGGLKLFISIKIASENKNNLQWFSFYVKM
jgi:hypothetical protein